MMGIGCVLMGTACAAIHGNTEVLPATLCIIFVVFMQMAANFYYRYYDVANSCGNDIDSRIASHAIKESGGFSKSVVLHVSFLLPCADSQSQPWEAYGR